MADDIVQKKDEQVASSRWASASGALAPMGNGQDAVDLRQYWEVLVRRWRIAALCVGITVLSSALFTLLSRPVFEATAMLEVKDTDSEGLSLQKMFDSSGLGAGFSERLNTEVEVLKSRQVAEGAVRRAGEQLVLDTGERVYASVLRRLAAAFSSKSKSRSAPAQEPLGVELLQAPSVFEAEEYQVRFGKDGTFVVRDWDGQELGKGTMGEPFQAGPCVFRLTGTPPEAGTRVSLTLRPLEDAVKEAKDNLQVTAIRQTRLIRLQMTGSSPAEAEKRLAALIASYQAIKVQQKTTAASQALDFITGQMRELEREVQDSMGHLTEFKQEKRLISLPDSVKAMVDQVSDLDKSVKQLQLYRQQANFLLQKLEKEDQPFEKESIFSLGTALNEPLLVTLATELSRQEVERAALRQAYTERHPYMQIMKARISETRGKIRGELQRLVASLDSKLQEADRQVKSVEGLLERLPAEEQRLVELTRKAKVYEDMHAFLLQKQGELQITKAVEIGGVWVVEPAKGNPVRLRPGFSRNVMLAAVVGLMLGVGLVFLLEYLDDSVKSPTELEKGFGVAVLASVPHHSDSWKGKRASSIYLPILRESESTLAEAFRTLRSNILFTGVDRPVRAVVVSSPLPDEGKSTCSANLAVAMAQLEKRVLLLDGDLRRPVLAECFGCHRSPGLVETIMAADLQEALEANVQRTEVEGLDFLASGRVPPNPNEMLSSQKLKRLLQVLAEQYDFLVIDAPPVAAASDALVLASQGADGILLVVKAKSTPRASLKRTVEVVAKAQLWLLGAVINDVDLRRDGYYYHYYRYYASRYHYGAKEVAKNKPRRVNIWPQRRGRSGTA